MASRIKTVRERMDELLAEGIDPQKAADKVLAEVKRGEFGHTSTQGKGAATKSVKDYKDLLERTRVGIDRQEVIPQLKPGGENLLPVIPDDPEELKAHVDNLERIAQGKMQELRDSLGMGTSTSIPEASIPTSGDPLNIPVMVENTQPNPDAGEFTVEDLLHRPGVYVVTITPDMASKLLARNVNNRSPKERAIQAYAQAMMEERWELTNQGIGFDRQGSLTDGQNRLMACMRAGVPFRTMIATGLSPESKEKVDVGVKRSLADALRMHGYVNAPALAGGISLRSKYEWLIDQGVPWTQTMLPHGARNALGGTYAMSHPASIEFLEKRPSISQRTGASWVIRKTFPRVPLSVIICFESLALEISESALADFRNALITGANLNPEDPRLVLRNYLTRLEPRKAVNSLMLLGVFIKAWNAWRQGERRQILALRENEQMPVMV